MAGVAEEYDLYIIDRIAQDSNFEEGALYAGKNALIYDSVTEEGNIYTVLKNSDKKYVDSFEVIKGELIYSSQNKQELKWAQEIGIKINPYLIIDGELMSSELNLYLMDEATGTIVIPENVTKIGEGAFSNVSGLRKIVIPSTVKEIAPNAFSNNKDIEEVEINNGVERIGERAFFYCAKLQKITLPDSIIDIGSECFRYCYKLDNVKLPTNLTTLKALTFDACSNLKQIELSKKLKILQGQSLAGTAIQNLKFYENLENIEQLALNISTLKQIDTSENNYYTFKDGILYTKNMQTLVMAIASCTNVNIENSVTTITGGAFNICNIAEINIPANVEKIGSLAFDNWKLSKITVDSNNKYFKTDEKNNLYSYDGKMLYRIFDKGDVNIKDGVENIQRGAFVGGGYKSVTLPESYTGNNTNEWAVLPTLDYLFLPKNVNSFFNQSYVNVKSIEVSSENQTFKSINNEYILSKNGKELYWVKQSLTNVQIPETIEIIKTSAFRSVAAENIKLHNRITQIGDSAFISSKIKKIEIPSSIEFIHSRAFSGANNLTQIIIDKKNDGTLTGTPWGCTYGLRAISWKD